MSVSWTLTMVLLGVVVAQFAPIGILGVVALAVLGYIALGLFSAALKGVYTAALYRYATQGDAGYFDGTVLDRAFRQK